MRRPILTVKTVLANVPKYRNPTYPLTSPVGSCEVKVTPLKEVDIKTFKPALADGTIRESTLIPEPDKAIEYVAHTYKFWFPVPNFVADRLERIIW